MAKYTFKRFLHDPEGFWGDVTEDLTGVPGSTPITEFADEYRRRRAANINSCERSQDTAAATCVMDRASALRELGLQSENCAQSEIKHRYRELVRQWHPDKLDGMAPELKAIANERLARISSAYTFLVSENGR